MVLDSLSSPQRRSQNASTASISFKKHGSLSRDGITWSSILSRHRFLLTMLALLAFLCTIYLYFAITLGAGDSCSELSGADKASCQAKSSSLHKGKLKFF